MSDVPAGTGAFELSRAYGEGWKTAKQLLASAKCDIDSGDADARNPHSTPEKRARWTQGFVDAVGTSMPAARRWGGNSWRSRTR